MEGSSKGTILRNGFRELIGMEKIDGMLEDFMQAKVLLFTTLDEKGKKLTRPMTNYNTDPYKMMWFPTFGDTFKVGHIMKNPKVLILFPRTKEGEFYEIEGKAEFEEPKVTEHKWKWWYLFWHPELKSYPWIMQGGKFPDRVIINVQPMKARIIKAEDVGTIP